MPRAEPEDVADVKVDIGLVQALCVEGALQVDEMRWASVSAYNLGVEALRSASVGAAQHIFQVRKARAFVRVWVRQTTKG